MSYSSAVLALNPFAYYRCDEGPGATQLLDSSGNAHHMPLFGSGWTFQAPSLLKNGDTDYAIQMGGTQYGSINQNFGMGAKTIICLFKPLALDSAMVQWYGNGVAAGNTAGVPNGGYFGLCTTNPLTGLVYNAYHFTVGTAYFVAMTFYGYQTAIWINGVYAGNANPGATGQTGSFSLNTIGYTIMTNTAHANQTVYGNGVIDEVAIFSGVMSGANIQNLAVAAGYLSGGVVTLSGSGRIKAKVTDKLTATARIGHPGNVTIPGTARVRAMAAKILGGNAVIAAGLPYSVNASATIAAQASLSLNASATIGFASNAVVLPASATIGMAGLVSLGASATIGAPQGSVALTASGRIVGGGAVVLGGSATIITPTRLAWVDRKLKVTPIFRDSYATLANLDTP